MGITTVRLKVGNPHKPSKKVEGEYLVDTGAHYTVLPGELVKDLGLKASYSQEFALADGKVVRRNIGSATINFESREFIAPKFKVNLKLVVDPFKRKIYASKLMA